MNGVKRTDTPGITVSKLSLSKEETRIVQEKKAEIEKTLKIRVSLPDVIRSIIQNSKVA